MGKITRVIIQASKDGNWLKCSREDICQNAELCSETTSGVDEFEIVAITQFECDNFVNVNEE